MKYRRMIFYGIEENAHFDFIYKLSLHLSPFIGSSIHGSGI